MDKYITFYEIAEEAGCGVDTIRRNSKKLNLEIVKTKTASSSGALLNCLSRDDANALINFFEKRKEGKLAKDASDISLQRFGFFYLIQLVPEALPNRFKIGYTDNLEQRLNSHRTAAPTSVLIKSWPCKRSWDYAAMDSITRVNCVHVLNEVYEGELSGFIERGDSFFINLPSNEAETETILSKHSPLKNNEIA